MRLLFVMGSAEYLRYYDDTIRLLASRGHEILLGVNHDSGRKLVTLEDLARETGGRVSALGVVPVAPPFWDRVTRGLRGTVDFVRYLDPRFAEARALRARIRRKVLPRALHALDRIPSLPPYATRALTRILVAFERAIPTVREVDELLARAAPDLVVVTPLVDAASRQVDIVKSAQRLGIPVGAAIASWDNLTNKGLLRLAPDLVVVWNEIQKEEAVNFHGMAPERVAVTGAQLFDRWFAAAPSRTADELCRTVGLPSTRPYALFTCSSGFIAEGHSEVAFVRRWIQALRASDDPAVADLPVLVRPHPYNAKAWVDADLSDLRDVAVWPRGSYNPVAGDTRAGFFDSLHHSAAVVGINTSAMIEAAIVGRPVLTIRAPEFAATQEGTLHFHYLLPEHGGFVRVAESLEQHVVQLASVLQRPDESARQLTSFVDRFIRPRGRDLAATPLVVDTLESLARRPVPRRRHLAALPLRPAAWALAAASAAVAAASGGWAARARKTTRLRIHRARKSMARLAR